MFVGVFSVVRVDKTTIQTGQCFVCISGTWLKLLIVTVQVAINNELCFL